MRRWTFPLLGLIAAVVVSLPTESVSADDAKTGDAKMLFNGKNLDGWDTWLHRPHKSTMIEGLKKNDKGEYVDVVGLNKDPLKVYTVTEVDGQPAIRISGQIFGALTTKDEFENYHLSLQFKWGEKKWPPRETAVRDSGLLYHCVGPFNAIWLTSLELQIQEKDCGDFFSVNGPTVNVQGERKNEKGPIIYKKGGQLFENTRSRIIRDVDHEKPHGEWNTIELYTVGQTSVHMVNGKVNMILTNAMWEGKPLTKGKIQLQSEGAEVFYRNIVLKPIKAIPEELLK